MTKPLLFVLRIFYLYLQDKHFVCKLAIRHSGGSRISRRGRRGYRGGGVPRSDTATLPLVCKNERIWTLREGARQGCLPASANPTSKPSYSLSLFYIYQEQCELSRLRPNKLPVLVDIRRQKTT